MDHHNEEHKEGGFLNTVTNTEGSGIFAVIYIILAVLFLCYIVFAA